MRSLGAIAREGPGPGPERDRHLRGHKQGCRGAACRALNGINTVIGAQQAAPLRAAQFGFRRGAACCAPTKTDPCRNTQRKNQGRKMRRRQSIRLSHYDYTQSGAYFITICSAQRECLFGDIRDGAMHTNTIGDLVAQTWHSLPRRFPRVTLDAFVIMPNHVHGVVCISEIEMIGADRRGAACRAPVGDGANFVKGAASSAPTSAPTAKSLAHIIRTFKSISAIAANRLLQREGQPLWQRNYYERIIRNDEEWNRIREYIINNPAQWDDDDENPLRMND